MLAMIDVHRLNRLIRDCLVIILVAIVVLLYSIIIALLTLLQWLILDDGKPVNAFNNFVLLVLTQTCEISTIPIARTCACLELM